MNVAELTGSLLDYWVARAEGYALEPYKNGCRVRNKDGEVLAWIGEGQPPFLGLYAPSINWAQGGPLIEREFMNVGPWNVHSETKKWQGSDFGGEFVHYGATFLEAGMRAYVASKFGAEVPDEVPT